jgi:hypothetical protein
VEWVDSLYGSGPSVVQVEREEEPGRESVEGDELVMV